MDAGDRPAVTTVLEPAAHFAFCPRCGDRAARPGARPFHCPACGFLYYFNAASSAAALVIGPDGRGLFIRRAKEPARGRLALVGGFIDPGETAESALRREVREEVGVELDRLEYLSSHPNDYRYREIIYPVLDLFFVGYATDVERARALDGVEAISWQPPLEVDPDEMAFPSMRAALQRFQQLSRMNLPRSDRDRI